VANTIIFSDTHLSAKFDPVRFEYLKRITEPADQVIINGDFWEGYLTTIEKFVDSDWNKLFPLLLERNTFYIYGNHDKEKFNGVPTSQFSVGQGYEYRVRVGNQVLRIEHGNRIIPDYDDQDWYPRSKLIGAIRDRAFRVAVNWKGKQVLRRFHKMNDRIKAWGKINLAENEILVCGHTHQSEFNLGEKFIDLGFIDLGYASYLKVIDDRIELVEDKY
jgi:predicted phosphodiesterase